MSSSFARASVRARVKAKVVLRAGVLPLLAAALSAQQPIAPTPDAVGSPRGENVSGYNIMNSFETGYRFSSVDGNLGQYRSDVNYGNGIRLLSSQLSVHSLDGKGGLFDEIVLTTLGLGNDPYQSAMLRVQKNGLYRYDMQWRLNDYYNPALTVAVNASGLQLDDDEFPSLLESVLASTSIAPGTLVLEITESKLIHDDSRALELLDRLHATGIRLAIDDFGTGYSSLGYLRQLPVDIIKIDRSFVSQLDDDAQTEEIVRAIITMAHTLGMRVVGEGVETMMQLRTLSALDCDYFQGFLLARPDVARTTSRVLRHVDVPVGAPNAGSARDAVGPRPRRRG